MGANTSPIFTKQGNFTPVRITAASADPSTPVYSGTDFYTLVTSATDGTRVDGVRFINAQTTAGVCAAKVFRIYLSNASGANFRLIGEVAAAQATRSATAIGQTAIYFFDQPIIMKTGQIMAVSASVASVAADITDACAFAGDY